MGLAGRVPWSTDRKCCRCAKGCSRYRGAGVFSPLLAAGRPSAASGRRRAGPVCLSPATAAPWSDVWLQEKRGPRAQPLLGGPGWGRRRRLPTRRAAPGCGRRCGGGAARGRGRGGRAPSPPCGGGNARLSFVSFRALTSAFSKEHSVQMVQLSPIPAGDPFQNLQGTPETARVPSPVYAMFLLCIHAWDEVTDRLGTGSEVLLT